VVTGKSVEAAEHELMMQAILSLRSEIINLREALSERGQLRPEQRVEPAGSSWMGGQIPTDLNVEEMEKELIGKALAYTKGNRKKAAQLLGIGERTLYRKLDKYKLR
jgi:DNA-binding NtrC family response regulator